MRLGGADLELARGDLTDEDADAIVNAANSSLMGGGGVDGAIHRRGGPAILEACRTWVKAHGRLPPGHAVITPGGNLPARFVIHTVGPVYARRPADAETLASCYRESLALAEQANLETVSFPSISTGAYGYPLEEAAPVALGAVAEHLRKGGGLRRVRFVLFDARTLAAYAKALDALDGPQR